MEAADKVLPCPNVDRRLATYRRIHLRKQCRRDLNEIAAALQNGCRKANKVTNDTATKRDQMVAALDPQVQQFIHQAFKLLPAFCCLSAGQDDGVAVHAKGTLQLGKLMFSDVGVGDNDRASSRQLGAEDLSGLIN